MVQQVIVGHHKLNRGGIFVMNTINLSKVLGITDYSYLDKLSDGIVLESSDDFSKFLGYNSAEEFYSANKY